MKRLIFVFLLILFASNVGAATRYTDGNLGADCTSGNYSIANRNCTGSDGNAYNTIQEGENVLAAGDTLFIRSGTYTESPTLGSNGNGTSSARTVIAGYPSERPIIRGMFTINERTWVHIKNFTQEGGVSGIYGIQACAIQNSIIEDIIADDNSNTNFRLCSGSGDAGVVRNVIVRNVRGNGSVVNNGLSLSSDSGPANRVDNVLVEDAEFGNNFADAIVAINIFGGGFTCNRCTLYGSGEDGIDFKGDFNDGVNITISNSYIHSNAGHGLFFNEDFGWRNVRIFKNRFVDNQSSTGHITALGFSALQGSEVRQIWGNLFVHTNSGRKHTQMGGPNASWEWYNNTFIGGSIGIDQRGSQFATIKNNIFQNQATAGIFFPSGSDAPTTITENNNLFYRADNGVVISWRGTTYTSAQAATYRSATKQGANSIFGSDPLLISSSTGGLQATSPAINAGTSVPTTGFNGTATDIGMNETFGVLTAEALDAGSIVVIFQVNVNSPLLPASACTGFTVQEDTGGGFTSKTMTGCNRSGTNGVRPTFTPNLTFGSAIRFSYSTGTGNVTDSALIGNSLNQRLNAITNHAVTNKLSSGGSTNVTTAKNNIIWANGGSPIVDSSSTLTQSNNLCESGCALSSDPLFLDPASFNFKLSQGSPAVNQGATLGAPFNIDALGIVRPQGGSYDLGAYEFVIPGGVVFFRYRR